MEKVKLYWNYDEITNLKQLETLIEEAFINKTKHNNRAKFSIYIWREEDGSFIMNGESYYFCKEETIRYLAKDWSVLYFGTRKQTKVETICFTILRYIEDEIQNPDRERQYLYQPIIEEHSGNKTI